MMGTVPPSTLQAAPVTNAACSEQRKAITAAIYEQLLLLQLDRKLADHGLSKMPGTLIRDGAPTPLRPQHMRADATGSWWIFRSGEDDDIELDEGALPDMS